MKRNSQYKTKDTSLKDVVREWYLIDAKGLVLGDLAVKVSKILLGKNKVYYSSHIDCGDYVIVINAEKIKVTGKKASQKTYFRHSGYPGGAKTETLNQVLEKDARKAIEHAVKGMLPKNKLGNAMIDKLYVYNDENHLHAAQNPKVLI